MQNVVLKTIVIFSLVVLFSSVQAQEPVYECGSCNPSTPGDINTINFINNNIDTSSGQAVNIRNDNGITGTWVKSSITGIYFYVSGSGGGGGGSSGSGGAGGGGGPSGGGPWNPPCLGTEDECGGNNDGF